MTIIIKLLLSLFLAFSFEIELKENVIYEVSEFFDKIKKIEITEEDSKSLVDNLKKILERYVFFDILKNPPQPSENYFNTVDLIDELNNINSEKRSLYEFYREIKTILNRCQDLHLDITLDRDFGDNIKLNNAIFAFPVILAVLNDEIHAVPNPMFPIDTLDENILDIINANILNAVISIKGSDPFDYIQKFNGNF